MKLYRITILLIAVVSLYGDVMYEATMSNKGKGAGKSVVVRTYVKGVWSRAEMGDVSGKSSEGMIVITRLDKGVAWMLNPQGKTYSEFRFADLKKLQRGAAGDTIVPKINIQKTAESKKVLNMSCQKVMVSAEAKSAQGGTKYVQTMWVAKNMPGAKEILDFQKKMFEQGFGVEAGGGGNKAMLAFQKKISELDGFPLISDLDIKVEGGPMSFDMKTHTEVTKIDTKSLNQSLFELPAGYKANK